MAYKSNVEKLTRTSEAVGFPEVILIDNTNACNLRCSMCDHPNVKNYRKIQTMDIELYEKIIDEIALENPSARIWQIFFGDPCLCKDMGERIRYAKSKGLSDVVLNSNGVLLSADKAEEFVKAGLDAIYVGIDAASKDVYDQIRVGGDYDKAVENVLRYRDYIKKFGHEGQKVFVQFVVSDINEHQVEAFKDFWTSQDVAVKIRPKISWAGLKEATNLVANSDVERKPCYWIMRTINICADGEIALCSADIHCRVKCGNIKDASIRDVWNNRLKEYRQMHRDCKFDDLPEMCRQCSDWQSGYADYF